MRTHGLLVLHVAALLSQELYLLADKRSCCLHLRQEGSGAASSGSGAWEWFDAEPGNRTLKGVGLIKAALTRDLHFTHGKN